MLKNKKSLLGNRWVMLYSTLLLLCALPSLASAQPLRVLLEHVAQTHPAIVSQYEQILASEAVVGEAKSGYLPRLGVNASYSYQEQERKSGGLTGNSETNSKPLDASLSISQNIFEGFRTDATVAGAQASLLATNSQFDAARQQIFLQAINSYIQLLKQRHLLQLAQQNIQTLQNQVALEQERMVAGTGISVDVLSTKSRLQLAHERYANFLGGFQQAEASFVQFFGVAPDYRSLRMPSVSPAAIPRQLPQAIQTALMNSPSLHQSEYQSDAADKERTVARANYFPRFDVVATSSHADSDDPLSGETNSNSIALRGSWELFSGFADKARETRAVHNYQSSIAAADNTRRQVIENTKRAWAQLTALQQRSTILQNAVTISEQVYAARRRLRDIGSETAINVLNAESELFSSRINATSVQYDSYLALYQLLQAVGMLELSSIL